MDQFYYVPVLFHNFPMIYVINKNDHINGYCFSLTFPFQSLAERQPETMVLNLQYK